MPARSNPTAEIFALRRGPVALGGPFRLRPRLEHTLRLLPGGAGGRRIRLRLDILAQVPDTLVGDARALRRTVADLVGLALRRMDRGEVVVHVAVASQTADEVLLRFTVRSTDPCRGGSTFRFNSRYGLPRTPPRARSTPDLDPPSRAFDLSILCLPLA